MLNVVVFTLCSYLQVVTSAVEMSAPFCIGPLLVTSTTCTVQCYAGLRYVMC